MRNRLALLTALGVDNFGSGLFLPLALLYATRVVGLPLATAGTGAGLAAVALSWLALRLPGDAVRPEPAGPPQVAVR
jgi:hypothetical protein